jgi:hypothetical protein
MKTQRRFKAPDYSRGCLLAKAFGVSAANSGSALPARRGGPVTISKREGKMTNYCHDIGETHSAHDAADVCCRGGCLSGTLR